MFLVQAPGKIQLSSSNVIWCWENHSHRAFFYRPCISKFLDDQDMHSLLTESYWPHSSDLLNVTCTNVMQSISKHTELHDYIFSSGKHLIKHVWCTSFALNKFQYFRTPVSFSNQYKNIFLSYIMWNLILQGGEPVFQGLPMFSYPGIQQSISIGVL